MRLYFFIVIFIILLLGGFFVWQGVYLPKSQGAVEEIFVIEEGKGAKEIAASLENQNLIKHRYLFKFYILARGVYSELQAGAYLLSSSMSISEITNRIATGDVFTKKITIPEGFNIRQIERRFSEIFNREMDFARFKVSDFQGEFDFLKDVPKQMGLQGFLFPDTYEFDYLISEEEIIREMLGNFDRKLDLGMGDELRSSSRFADARVIKEIASQRKSIFDIVIMASLLEGEVRGFEDKKIVSGIFWKRINIGKPLQSCATIAYILQREGWTFQEMRREIGKGKKIDSPYNTYMYRGLPIGPISNPGLESIIAAIYPETSEYLFFLSTPESQTIFSANLREHSLAKQKYLR